MKRQNPTEQADNLQNNGFGPCKLRGLPAIYRVLYQTQGWGETLLFGGKRCPLRGVGEVWVCKRAALTNFPDCQFLRITCVDLPRKQEIAVNKLWAQESEIGEECRQFWT